MKKILVILSLLGIGTNILAQGLRINYKTGASVEWNYNDFDSIVVDYSSQRKIYDHYRTLPIAMKENSEIKIFTEALFLTGLDEEMTQWRDSLWNPTLYADKSIYAGAQWDYCHVPEHRLIRFTIFATPDAVLRSRYGITSVQDLYNYARSLYGGESLNVTDVANRDKLRQPNNPLRRLIAYNCLQSCPAGYGMYTTICTIATEMVNPTEWYATLDGGNLLKIEQLSVSNEIGIGENDKRGDLYLNRSGKDAISGVHVDYPTIDNWAINGAYYITDGLADFSEKTLKTVFNTRIRMDFYTLFPEMMNNDIRDGRTNNRYAESNNPDKSVSSPNYWFPAGYVGGLEVPEEATFMFQSQHNTFWSYEGDEFHVFADNPQDVDITLQLPKLPDGEYQLRLGICVLVNSPIAQCYFDGQPVGIPVDMSDNNFVSRTGWFNPDYNYYSTEELQSALQTMHNMGWYHGPRSVFNLVGEGNLDGSNASRSYFSSNSHTVRYVVGIFQFNESVQHTLRIKNVSSSCNLLLDYLEFVPKSVYESNEDNY